MEAIRLRVNETNTGHIRAAMIGTLCLGGVSGLMATGLLGPFRDDFAGQYQLSQGQLGTAIAVIGIVLGIIGIWQGPKLADRIGRYRLLKCSVGMMVIGLVGCGLVGHGQRKDLPGLVAFWGLFMLGAYLSIIVNAVVTDLWRDRPRRGVMLLHSVLSIGKIIGPVIAWFCMILLDTSGWRGFFFFGAATSLTILVFLSFVPQGKVYHPRETHSWEEAPVERPFAMWLAAALLGLMAGGETALATIAPLFFAKQHLLSTKLAATLLAFHFAAVAGGRFAFGLFGGKLSSRTIVALGFLPAALMIPAAYSAYKGVSVVCFVLAGFSFSATWPCVFTHVASVFSQNRSRLALAVGLSNAAGIALGTFATSQIFETNRPLSLAFGPAALVFSAAMFILLQKTFSGAGHPRESSPAE